MSKIICFKILQLFEALSEKIFHDHTGFIDKANFYSIFPSTTYHWIEMIAVPLGIIAMVFGFLYYIPNAKKISKKHGPAWFKTNSYREFSHTISTFAQMAAVEVMFLYVIKCITTLQIPEICKWILLIICIFLEIFIQFHVYVFLGGICRMVFMLITIGLVIIIYPIIYPIILYKEKRYNPLNKIGE